MLSSSDGGGDSTISFGFLLNPSTCCLISAKNSQQLAEKVEPGHFYEYLIVIIYQPVALAQWEFAACHVNLFVLPFLILLKVNRVSFDEGSRFDPANLVAAVDGNAVENVCSAFV